MCKFYAIFFKKFAYIKKEMYFCTHYRLIIHNMLKKLLLNDKFILSVILLNSCIIYAQVSGYENVYIGILDLTCTLIFLMEMIFKQKELGISEYWQDGWNKLDGTLVILSLPSVAALFVPNDYTGLSILLIFRLLRVLRFFRVLHFFPNFSKVIQGFKRAMSESYAILLSFLVIIIIFGLLNCSLFKEADPEHFQTPLRSIYAVFQICTVEGWYEIPNTLAQYYGASTVTAELVRLYFCALLILGGIIGMSFINSIFVDAMVADNNDETIDKLEEIQKSIEEIKQQLNEKN